MTYMTEPQPAAPYQGNAATKPFRLLAYRLARADVSPAQALRDPELVLRAGRPAWARLIGTGSAGAILFFAFFVHHRAWLGPDMGSLARIVFWLLGVGFVDTLLFHGHSAATAVANVEAQWDCLKWTEGVEIGQMGWADLAEAWLWHEPLEGESAVEQTRRGGRRLILCDQHGQRLFVPERDAAFDALLARLRLERPDVPTRVVEPEKPAAMERERDGEGGVAAEGVAAESDQAGSAAESDSASER